VDTGHQTAYDGLQRAARLAASIAGARGADVDEIAEEALALLLLQDGLVNNPKAWVRSTATRLVRETHSRRRISTADVLGALTPAEQKLLVGHRAGFTLRELGGRLGISEDQARTLVAQATGKIRRSGNALADAR
jgi:DNA-directed RNA polymerase specialized sigma24 family protein